MLGLGQNGQQTKTIIISRIAISYNEELKNNCLWKTDLNFILNCKNIVKIQKQKEQRYKNVYLKEKTDGKNLDFLCTVLCKLQNLIYCFTQK